MKQFAVNIKNARKRKGYSQKGLAKEVGCPPTTLAGWEQGKFVPNKKHLGKLSSTLDLQMEELIDSTENPEDELKILALEQAQNISNFEDVDKNVETEQLSDLIKGYWILNEKERFQLVEMMKVLIASRKFNDKKR